MRYVAAYLLAALGGKEQPSAGDLEKILSSVGIEADTEKLKLVIKLLSGKNLDELIAAGGRSLLACLQVVVLQQPPQQLQVVQPQQQPQKKEEKKPEKKEESESEDDDMGFGLFD